jgi:hypothetical protein
MSSVDTTQAPPPTAGAVARDRARELFGQVTGLQLFGGDER